MEEGAGHYYTYMLIKVHLYLAPSNAPDPRSIPTMLVDQFQRGTFSQAPLVSVPFKTV